MLGSNKTRIVKLEQARGARARRYVFYFDEVAEAEAQGLPYVLVPRVLSSREWMERYAEQPPPIQVINDRTGQCEIAEDWQRLDRRLQLPPGAAVNAAFGQRSLIGRASRFTAGAFGFLNLSQSFERPEM